MGLRDSLVKATPQAPTVSLPDPLTVYGQYPLTNYRFTIEIGGSVVALFQKVTGLEVERKTADLTEGGHNEYIHEFPGNMSYNHITFQAGLSSSDFFYQWMMAGKESGGYAEGKDFTLEQRFLDPAVDPLRWDFDGAFPVKWKTSGLSIDDSKSIVIETLELSFNTFLLAEP
jgi:phage tail-like protein